MPVNVDHLPPEVQRVLARRDRYSASATCLNPDCSNTCNYPETVQGRRQLFCSKKCAAAFTRRRQALLDDIAAINDALASPVTASAVRVRLIQQRTHAYWHLSRYGGGDDPRLTGRSSA
jgi:hypothetical protein